MTAPASERTLDRLSRPLRSLRLSVTDRCNLRCHYCMPEEHYVWLPKASLLTFEEMRRLALSFYDVGVRKLRITGGEPLLRHDLADLIGMLRASAPFEDIALTTNGVLLTRHAAALKQAGLDRVTLSLDTLRADRFTAYSRGSRLDDVIRGVEALGTEGFTGTKINAVVTRGDNDDELIDLFEFAQEHGAQVRFIEYMDVGGATGWTPERVVSQEDMLKVFTERFDAVTPVDRDVDDSAPAVEFRLPDGRTFGIVASTTQPFCRTCDRARLTADGQFFTCLYTDTGHDLLTLARSEASREEIGAAIRDIWTGREDRGAEIRAETPNRRALYELSGLRSNPHREMHTRGG